MKDVLNTYQRGVSGYYSENTMLAFRKAIEVQCYGALNKTF